MKTWKVLNLYAGIGGNRKLWENVDVTAVEINPKIAKIYQDFFPDDKVVIMDAHKFLLEHFDDGWDFIWSSPPCPTHSKIRESGSKHGQYKVKYPDMNLYQEIILLDRFFNSKWVVENVEPYYIPLIPGKVIGRHLFWSNFNLSKIKIKCDNINKGTMEDYRKRADLSKYVVENERRILRNMVNPKLGKHILDCARKNIQQTLVSK